jgi:hypothetical protein
MQPWQHMCRASTDGKPSLWRKRMRWPCAVRTEGDLGCSKEQQEDVAVDCARGI